MKDAKLPLGLWLVFLLVGLAASWLVVRGEVQMLVVAAGARERDAGELRAEIERGEVPAAEVAQRRAKAEGAAKSAGERRARAEAVRSRLPGLVLGFGTVLGLLLGCFHPRLLASLRALPRRRLAGLAAGVALWFSLATAEGFFSREGFNAYWPVILAAVAGSSAIALRGETAGRISAAGLALWLLLWIPFDLRWYKTLWLGPPEMEYAGFSLLVSLCGILAFAVGGGLDTLGVRPPRLRDLVPAGIFLLLIGVVVVPLGLVVGFLELTAPAVDPLGALFVGAGLALTVALPEELFFRGILDAGLEKHFRLPWVSLVVSSLAFGLMHWNNREGLGEQVAYVALASVAGAFYALAFRKTRGLAAPVLVHTLVDLAWQAFLRG